MGHVDHFRSGRATEEHRARVLTVLIELNGALASRREVQGRVFGDLFGADFTSTALQQLRDDGLAQCEGYGRRRFWTITRAGRVHHLNMVALAPEDAS